jgi:hypothetical protein
VQVGFGQTQMGKSWAPPEKVKPANAKLPLPDGTGQTHLWVVLPQRNIFDDNRER